MFFKCDRHSNIHCDCQLDSETDFASLFCHEHRAAGPTVIFLLLRHFRSFGLEEAHETTSTPSQLRKNLSGRVTYAMDGCAVLQTRRPSQDGVWKFGVARRDHIQIAEDLLHNHGRRSCFFTRLRPCLTPSQVSGYRCFSPLFHVVHLVSRASIPSTPHAILSPYPSPQRA